MLYPIKCSCSLVALYSFMSCEYKLASKFASNTPIEFRDWLCVLKYDACVPGLGLEVLCWKWAWYGCACLQSPALATTGLINEPFSKAVWCWGAAANTDTPTQGSLQYRELTFKDTNSHLIHLCWRNGSEWDSDCILWNVRIGKRSYLGFAFLMSGCFADCGGEREICGLDKNTVIVWYYSSEELLTDFS